jgi:ParB family chromosome partitioning protein
LALDKIRVDESKNLRRFSPDAKSIGELAESIKSKGLLQPVIVRPITINGDGCEYELVAGFRRMEAVKLNESPVVLARVLSFGSIDEGVHSLQNKLTNLTENRERAELSYMDQAHAAKELLDAGMKRQDIAKAFGKSPAWATRILKFLELRPKIQKLIHEGKVPFRAAAIMPDLSEEKQDELLTEIERQEKGTPSASEKVDRASQKRKARKKKVAKKVAAKAKKLVAKKLAADPRIKEGEKFKVICKSITEAHAKLRESMHKSTKKVTARDKALFSVLGALRGYLSGKPLKVFTSAVGKLL